MSSSHSHSYPWLNLGEGLLTTLCGKNLIVGLHLLQRRGEIYSLVGVVHPDGIGSCWSTCDGSLHLTDTLWDTRVKGWWWWWVFDGILALNTHLKCHFRDL